VTTDDFWLYLTGALYRALWESDPLSVARRPGGAVTTNATFVLGANRLLGAVRVRQQRSALERCPQVAASVYGPRG
jgi:hypothetical protein